MNENSLKKLGFVLCFLAAIAFGLLVAQTFITYKQAREDWQSKKKELAKVKGDIRTIEKNLVRYTAEKEEFKKYFFEEMDIPKFLDSISKYAIQSSVNIEDMKTKKFSEVKVPDEIMGPQSELARRRKNKQKPKFSDNEMKRILTLAALPIDIKVRGSYANLVKFLGFLEEFGQLLSVSNVEITSDRDYPVLKCRFTLKIYSLKTLEELKRKS